MNALIGGLIDLLLPRHCLVSGRPLGPDEPGCVAPEILREAKLTAGDYCSRCGARQGESVGAVHGCSRCAEFSEGFSCSEISSAGDYEGVLREMCIALKFRAERQAAGVLAQFLIQQAYDRGFAAKADAVVALPLHAIRQWQRGYNQAELLAQPLAKAIGKPLLGALKRKRGTEKQSELSAAQRKSNVEGAFEIRPKFKKAIEGKTLLLVDDIMTTGATIKEAALALKRAGAKAVYGVVVARSTVGADGN